MMDRLSQEVETLKREILKKHLNKLKSSQSSSGGESGDTKLKHATTNKRGRNLEGIT